MAFEENTNPLTTAAGAPVTDNQNSMSAGPRGPLLLQDLWLIEKLAHFAREVIPERRMHAKGSGAFGTFRLTHDITRYTKAAIFSKVGNTCEMFARFSTVAGERGAADAERDIRGYALRFYTTEGNWDVVGNNTPVFFHRDPLKFPDLNRAVKRDPRTNLRDPENNWGFWTNLPESLHQVTITMSDRGIPKSFRHMHGYGSHAYSLINAQGQRHWVKFHFRTQQGIECLTDAEATELIGRDRESHGRDLFEVGEYELNRNPDNYFADVEQAAFTPSNLVPGISFSPDKMLQGRLFSYGDAARYRVGVNHHQIPVNYPRAAKLVNTYHRDGSMRVDGNQGGVAGVEPNNFGRWAEQPTYADPAESIGSTADHFDFREDDENYFEQPGDLFRLMTGDEQQRLFDNTARAIKGARHETVETHIANCTQADPAYGEGVRKACEALGAL